ncbi:MAG TPA: PqqD family protein [Pyrinomonadaceae bacterium]
MSGEFKPQARKSGLVVNEVQNEIVVYDLENHKAHCLNQTAALIWKRCDGRTAPAKIAAQLQKELKAPVNEGLVWYAIEQLSKDDLLVERFQRQKGSAGLSRRELVKRLGLTAVIAIPLITTIVAPTAVEAAASGCVDCNGVLCCPPATCPAGVCITT